MDVDELIQAARDFWDANTLPEERTLFPAKAPPEFGKEAVDDLDAAWGDDDEGEGEEGYGEEG